MSRLHASALALLAVALLAPSSALAAAPTPTTGPAKNVTYSGATLTGTVNPNGSQTNYYFQYGTSTKYSSRTPLTPAGKGKRPVAASAAISGLKAETTYHFRLVAMGASTRTGADRTFTTPKVPLSVQISASPNPVVFGSAFVVSGTLSGTGNGNKEIVLQATPFPYTSPFANIGNPEVTHADGTFTFPFTGLVQNAQLRVSTVSKPTVVSPVVIEGVAVDISIQIKRTRRGHARVQGTVTPPEVGAVVTIQRVARKGVQTVGRTSVRAANKQSSSFRTTVRVRRHALYRAAVTINDGAHVSNFSAPVQVR